MIPITVTPDIERAPWTDLLTLPPEKYLTKSAFGVVNRIGRMPRGTTSDKSTAVIQIVLDDGRTVLGETTLALLNGALAILNAAE